MCKAGIEAYKNGLKKKPLDHGLPKNPSTPKDLLKELNKSKKAKDFFKKLPPGAKKPYIYWILRAKREETRKKRIKEVVLRSKLGKRAGEK